MQFIEKYYSFIKNKNKFYLYIDKFDMEKISNTS